MKARCAAPWLLTAALAGWAAQAQPDTRRSGLVTMSPATQALQRDDSQNPAFLWLQSGRQRFEADCARCHTGDSLRGAATRYPAWDTALQQPLSLSARINQCQQRYVKAAPLAAESDDLLGLELVVAFASRGLPITPEPGAAMDAVRAQGRRLYTQRMGQLDLSCAQCHDTLPGRRLGGSVIPQGHPTGYPIYRLEWQALGSLKRRLRGCMTGVRAEPFAAHSAELTALESYLMQRAAGMLLETPAVRP